MKSLADMGIATHTVHFLRSMGYDAVHLREEGLADCEWRIADSNIQIRIRRAGLICASLRGMICQLQLGGDLCMEVCRNRGPCGTVSRWYERLRMTTLDRLSYRRV